MANAENQQSPLLERLAAESGVAVVVVDENSAEVAAANNNSMCRVLYPSPDYGRACAEYCGRAYARATEAGGPVEYVCHAGLFCRAVPVAERDKKFVAILGRTFVSAENYRSATDKAINGDWRRYPPTEFFENVILSGSPMQVERLEARIGGLDESIVGEAASKPRKGKKPAEQSAPQPEPELELELPPEPELESSQPDPFETSLLNYKLPAQEAPVAKPDPFETSMVNVRLETLETPENQDIADREAWRAFIPSLLKVSYRLACQRILEFLSRHYGIPSSLWMQREGNRFEMAAVLGELADRPVRIEIPVDDRRILAAVRDDSPIVLREQAAANRKQRVIQLFPVVIGGEVRNALGIAREEIDPHLSARILKFCRYVASRLEILRLRDAVAQQEYMSQVLREFNEQLRDVDADNFWDRLITVSARLIGAERASLLVRGNLENLSAKASVGAGVDLSVYPDLGSRVARTVLEKAKPVIVADTDKAALSPADPKRNYRSKSFISYPLTLGGEGIGVMNFTDKTGGEQFSKSDLEALDSIAPQIAVVLDRIMLREKVTEFAQLSVTDPLTGLLNRRYIEERLSEEINRSGRTGEPLSFLMIDVDQFKSYNDKFGHPAGDEALRIVGSILKENLRGADVAVRYGGEEFSVLLPGTNTVEATAIAERIRGHVDRTDFPKRKVTISVGLASISDKLNSVATLVDAADRALFRAKEGGRNNVKVYDPALDDGGAVH